MSGPDAPSGGWAAQVLAAVGGPGNVAQLTHCLARLRFVLHDPGLTDDAALDAVPEVLLLVRQSGQLQLVLRLPVTTAFREMTELLETTRRPRGDG